MKIWLTLVIGILVFLIGVFFEFSLTSLKWSSPPLFPQSQSDVKSSTERNLTTPWLLGRTPIKIKSEKLQSALPAQIAINRTAFLYLGQSTDTRGVVRYFFKYNPTGKIEIFQQHVTIDGWTLDSVNHGIFSLHGPGGVYEATY